MLVLVRNGCMAYIAIYIVITVAQHSLKVMLTSGLVIHCHFNQIDKRSVDKILRDTEFATDSNVYACLPLKNNGSSQSGSPDVPATK